MQTKVAATTTTTLIEEMLGILQESEIISAGNALDALNHLSVAYANTATLCVNITDVQEIADVPEWQAQALLNDIESRFNARSGVIKGITQRAIRARA